MVSPLRAVIASAVIVIVALLTFSIVGTLAEDTGGLGNETVDASVGINDTTAQFTTETVKSISNVRTSLNDSLALTGADDSELVAETDADLNESFSACTYAQADSSVVTNDQSRLLLSTLSIQLSYNGTDDTWRGRYENVSNGSAWTANVSASSPSTPTLVCANLDSGSFNVSANTTTGTAVSATGENTEPFLNQSNWDGTVDETRFFETALNGSQRTDYVNEPVLAVDGPAPAARLTYDKTGSDASEFEVYFSDTSATATGASLGAGRAGPAIAASTDYTISGKDITVVGSSTTLDTRGEVLYISFVSDATQTGSLFASLIESITAFSGVVALVPLILITVAIITYLKRA